MIKLKLKSKLAIFNAFSKALIITVLVLLIPWLVSNISIHETDQILIQKLDQVSALIDSLGIETFIDIDAEFQSFGSYNILKEEFISIEQITSDTLIDVIEMFCDWKASVLRHKDGDIMKSININQKRFKFSDELRQIFINTALEFV